MAEAPPAPAASPAVHPSLIAIRQLASSIVKTEKDRIRAEADAEYEREMELIKMHAADLTYKSTGVRVNEAKQAPQQSLIEQQQPAPRREGAELGKVSIRTVTGETETRHFGHGVFNRMLANHAKAQQGQQLLQTAAVATPMPAPAPAARNFRFRSWTSKAPADLAGFHVALAETGATVTASAEEQDRLERELNGLESVLLETSAAATTTSPVEADVPASEADADTESLDAELENAHGESFFELAHVDRSQKLGGGVGLSAHQSSHNSNNDNSNSNTESESEGEAMLEAKASALHVKRRESIENEIENAAYALAEQGKARGMRSQLAEVNRLRAYDAAAAGASGDLVSFAELGSSKAAVRDDGPKTGFVTPPSEPGWPFSEPAAREHRYDPPNVEQMPGPSGYGNLNGHESHAYDTLLHDRPPPSDRLQMGLSEPGAGGGAASLSENNAVMNAMMPQARMIATGPNANDVPVPYFPSQNPPPLAPMEKPAAPQTMMMQGTINQYMGPAMRPFSNQHEALQRTRIPVTAQMNPPIGQGYGVGPQQHPRLTNVGGSLEMRMMETRAGARHGARGKASSQGTLQLGAGYSLPDVPYAQGQGQPHMSFPTSMHFNQQAPVQATVYPVPAGQSQTPYPYQVTTGNLPTSENMRMPQQVPGFYGDMQLPHGSWAQVGHVDPSLQLPQFMSDTPYFPSQSVGPAYPPAAIEQPVNAAGGGARNYGGNMQFAPNFAG